MLLEDLGDGTSLKDLADDPPTLREVGGLARRIHAVTPPPWALPVHADWARWPGGDQRRARFSSLPRPHADRAQRLLDEMPAWPTEHAFLHGDLIPANVLRAPHGGLQAIDPYGMVGDRAYDLAGYACRCSDPPAALAHLVAGYGEAPPRLERWLELLCLYLAFQLPFWLEQRPPGLRAYLRLPDALPDDWDR